MKWIGAFFVGLLAGVIAGLAFVYFNPLAGEEFPQVESTALLDYEFGPSTLSLTHGGQLGFDLQPKDVPALWESTIRRSVLGIFVLENLQGSPVGIASRALKLSTQSNLLLRGLVADDHWLVTIPGAGSYFVEARENVWPMIRDTLIDVTVLRRHWSGTRRYELTIGPNRDGSALVTGASGRFAGTAGSAAHSVELNGYENLSQLQFPSKGQLRLDLRRTTE